MRRSFRRFLFALLFAASSVASAAGLDAFQTKLVGQGVQFPGGQGSAVAISNDGKTAIVGGNQDNFGAGAAWIYVRTGNVWSHQGSKLVGAGAAGAAHQGVAVALSADGNTAIVGGQSDNANTGAAWVFVRNAGVWSAQGPKLAGDAGAGAQLGIAVALSADGNTALIGGIGDGGDVGAAWVFVRNNGTWSQQGSKLVGTGALGASNQGRSVALSADGDTALIGGFTDDGIAGAAWVFKRSAGTWSQQGDKLVGTGAPNAFQGTSVALSADGNTALVGGFNDNDGDGATWVFTRSGTTWTQQGGKLSGTGMAGPARQGIAVALSSDGNTAVVGGDNDDSGRGAVWVFTRSGAVWSQTGTKLVGGLNFGSSVRMGASVAVSADGSTAIAGGPSDNGLIGAAWVFVAPPCTLDVDGNKQLDALTDGLLIIRSLFGLTGPTVTNSAIGVNAQRVNWEQIRVHLNENCGGSFQP